MDSPDWLSEYPGITVNRLVVLGDIVRVARDAAADDHRPETGETNWSLGVRGFERTNTAITWAAQEYPWLAVTSGASGGPVQFVFTIAAHPVRVCRGDAEQVPLRYQQQCFPELLDLENVPDEAPEGRFLRLTVENAPDGRPLRVYLHEIDAETGEPIRSFTIPAIMSSAGAVTPFAPPQAPAVSIPPVHAEPIDAEDEAQNDKTGSDDD